MNISPISFLSNNVSNSRIRFNSARQTSAQPVQNELKSQELLAAYIRPMISFKGGEDTEIDDSSKHYYEDLLKEARINGKPRFESFHISDIISALTEENEDCLPVLLNAKKDDGEEPRFKPSEIYYIMTNLTANNADSLGDLLKGNDNGYIIAAKLNSTK